MSSGIAERNYICSCLATSGIRTRTQLLDKLEAVVQKIRSHPLVFKAEYTLGQCYDMFTNALRAYSFQTESQIRLNEEDFAHFEKAMVYEVPRSTTPPKLDELARVTLNYDRFGAAVERNNAISKILARDLLARKFNCSDALILGAGDTGTTIWIEKYKSEHGSPEPKVLMLGETAGSWKHDYTLAQPHSLLERSGTSSNPSDFITRSLYKRNPRANARHIFQANQIILAETGASLISGIKILKIEKKANHENDWKMPTYPYRVSLQIGSETRELYTRELNICTGLGPARNPFTDSIILSHDLLQLSQFDPEKKFTPIVDGNQFILSNSEEFSETPRTIVVYGGGGTATACYRKAFFGNDIGTENRPFTKEHRKHQTFWIAAHGFDAAGKGKLATHALLGAQSRNELLTGTLKKITSNNGQLELDFGSYIITCDQLVYSTGQVDAEMKNVCSEIEQDLSLKMDPNGMPLSISTPDSKIHFFGAAAIAIRPQEYSTATLEWLHKENIGPDVGPGAMPPTRAQIKRLVSLQQMPLQVVNVNIDNARLIEEFLTKQGCESGRVSPLVQDIVELRRTTPSGFSKNRLLTLIRDHQLKEIIQIEGHSGLTMRTPTPIQPTPNPAPLFSPSLDELIPVPESPSPDSDPTDPEVERRPAQ